ncbi:MAG: hypothetical protein ACTSRS_10635 [Candidatus Helarchaeota archaeon]
MAEEKAPLVEKRAGEGVEDIYRARWISRAKKRSEVEPLEYWELRSSKPILLSNKEFNQLIIQSDQANPQGVEDPLEGLRLFTMATDPPAPVFVKGHIVYYPQLSQLIIEKWLHFEHFSVSLLQNYRRVEYPRLDPARLQEVQRTCPLRVGFLDQLGEVIIWVCDHHKTLYVAEADRALLEELFEENKRGIEEFYALPLVPEDYKDPQVVEKYLKEVQQWKKAHEGEGQGMGWAGWLPRSRRKSKKRRESG